MRVVREWLLCLGLAACNSSSSHGGGDVDAPTSGGSDGAPIADAPPAAVANRDRLLGSYLDWLKQHPGPTTNGLDGAQLADVCALWGKLQPSARSVFLTLTARLDGSRLARDGSTMLDHVTKLYWLTGGSGATSTSPGSCGGAGNRMIMSIDATLHAELVAANTGRGGPSGARTIRDVTPASFWRDTHDLAGPHDPFDLSNETEGGVPRGQVHYFEDPTSAAATSPLGRPDLMTLVDPFAFEFDHDYDCVHNSNPLCSYTLYGTACTPKSSKTGLELYGATYGAIDMTWKPAGC